MNKTSLFAGFAILIVLSVALGSAFSYSYDSSPQAYLSSASSSNYNYNNPYTNNYNANYIQNYFNTNTDTSNSLTKYNINNNQLQTSNYASAYQGPMAQQTSTYSEYLKIKPTGKVLRIISATTTNSYIGERSNINANSQAASAYNNDYLNTQNTNANAITSFSQKDAYNANQFGNSFGSGASSSANAGSYYYAPIYNYNQGYYNWRY